jgi:hypothetical protein
MTNDMIDDLNENLDNISDNKYQTRESAWYDIADCLGKIGITCPSSEEALEDLQDDELLFKLDEAGTDTPYFLYVIMSLEQDKYEVFATIATQADLDVLNAFMDDIEDND